MATTMKAPITIKKMVPVVRPNRGGRAGKASGVPRTGSPAPRPPGPSVCDSVTAESPSGPSSLQETIVPCGGRALRVAPRENSLSGELSGHLRRHRAVSAPLRLMAVHAHPDDESSKGAATMARYVAEGVEVLVCTC